LKIRGRATARGGGGCRRVLLGGCSPRPRVDLLEDRTPRNIRCRRGTPRTPWNDFDRLVSQPGPGRRWGGEGAYERSSPEDDWPEGPCRNDNPAVTVDGRGPGAHGRTAFVDPSAYGPRSNIFGPPSGLGAGKAPPIAAFVMARRDRRGSTGAAIRKKPELKAVARLGCTCSPPTPGTISNRRRKAIDLAQVGPGGHFVFMTVRTSKGLACFGQAAAAGDGRRWAEGPGPPSGARQPAPASSTPIRWWDPLMSRR